MKLNNTVSRKECLPVDGVYGGVEGVCKWTEYWWINRIIEDTLNTIHIIYHVYVHANTLHIKIIKINNH